jgi:hypothetical protein
MSERVPTAFGVPAAPSTIDTSSGVFRLLALGLAFILVTAALVYQCFSVRAIYFDETALHNAVYTSLHFGKVTSPAGGEFDSLTPHPPGLYYLVATLMRTGLSLCRAAGFLSVLAFGFFCLLVVSSRFSFAVKAGCLFGAFAGAFVWDEALLLRPDLMLTLTWLTGIVALESARLDHWNRWRLALGGLFITLPVAFHFIGVATCGALPLFGIWIWKTCDRETMRSRLFWMFGAAALVGIPVLLFVVIPHARSLVTFANTINSYEAESTPYARHMQAYSLWWQGVTAAYKSRPVVTVLTEPLFKYRIPAVFAALALLALLPRARGLAVAGMPHLLFLLFGARYKQISYSGYFAPEIALYLIGLTSAAAGGFFWLFQRLRYRWLIVSVAGIATAGFAIAALIDVPAILGAKRIFTLGVYDLENARAAGRRMLGPDSIVGATSAAVWFTSGADTFYNVSAEILYTPNLEDVDLRRYFSPFDAVVTNALESWSTRNRARANIATAYLDGTLRARGFFFGDRRLTAESPQSYMVYTARPLPDFAGYAVKGSTIYRFQPGPDGDQVFASAACPVDATTAPGVASNEQLNLDFYFRQLTPSATPGGHTPSAVIVNLIAGRTEFESRVRPSLGRCTIHDRIPGRLTSLEINRFRREAEVGERVMRFPHSYEEVREIAKARSMNGCACDVDPAGAKTGAGKAAIQ